MASASVVEILVELLRCGTKVTPEGDQLRFTPRLPAELRARVQPHKPEMLALFTGGEGCTDETTGSPALSSVPSVRLHGRSVPRTGCRSCRGREFILLENEQEWICARCHPPRPGTTIVARWIDAPATKPVKTSELFDTREVHDDL